MGKKNDQDAYGQRFAAEKEEGAWAHRGNLRTKRTHAIHGQRKQKDLPKEKRERGGNGVGGKNHARIELKRKKPQKWQDRRRNGSSVYAEKVRKPN